MKKQSLNFLCLTVPVVTYILVHSLFLASNLLFQETMNRFDNIFLDRMFISKYEPKLASVEDEPLITNQSLTNPLQSIVLIIIDEKTIDSLHKTTLFKDPKYQNWNTKQWPFDRRVMAMAINRINSFSPDLIGLDLLFLHPKNAVEDNSLTEAIKDSGKVVLASMVEHDITGRLKQHKLPLKQFAEAAAGIGFVNVDTDTDGILRSVPLTINDPKHDQRIFSFTLACWSKRPIHANFAINEVSIQDNKLVIPDRRDQRLNKSIELSYTDSNQSRLLINWKGPSNTFTTVSFSDLFSEDQQLDLQSKLLGKTVLIGLNHPGLQDSYTTPFYSVNRIQTPGVEIHANSLNTVSDEKYGPLLRAHFVLQILVYLLFAYALTFSTAWLKVSLSLPILVLELLIGWVLVNILFFQNLSIIFPIIQPLVSLLLCYLTILTIRVIYREFERNNIRKVFNQYVSNQVVNELLLNPDNLSMGGNNLEISTLFTDIRGFTSLSESKSAGEVVEILNTYFELMVAIITKHNGTINKFIGDAIMVLYGAPVRQDIEPKQQAILSVKTAIEMQETMKSSSDPRLKNLLVGIGISTGFSVVGNIGARKHKDYTAIGDKINLAARLQSKAEAFEIIVDEKTRLYCQDEFKFDPLEPFQVKGKQETIRAYRVNY